MLRRQTKALALLLCLLGYPLLSLLLSSRASEDEILPGPPATVQDPALAWRVKKTSVTARYVPPSPSPKSGLMLFLMTLGSSSAEKVVIYNRTIENLLRQGFTLVLFTDSPFWVKRSRERGIDCISEFETNEYNYPTVRSLFSRAMNDYPGFRFFVYLNSDILLTSEFKKAMDFVGSLPNERIFVTGRRTNVDYGNALIRDLTNDTESLLVSFAHKRTEFLPCAMDYFAITRGIFRWSETPPLVFGRICYDNYLVYYAATNPDVLSIDFSTSVRAIHQTGRDGNYAGQDPSSSDFTYNCILTTQERYNYANSGVSMILRHLKLNLSGIEMKKQKQRSDCK